MAVTFICYVLTKDTGVSVVFLPNFQESNTKSPINSFKFTLAVPNTKRDYAFSVVVGVVVVILAWIGILVFVDAFPYCCCMDTVIAVVCPKAAHSQIETHFHLQVHVSNVNVTNVPNTLE